jgi:hypothetical protein
MKTTRLSLLALICVTAQAAQATPLISLSQTPLANSALRTAATG